MGRTGNRKNLGIFVAIGQTSMVKSGPFRNQGFSFITTGFSGTIKLYASNQDMDSIAPDLSLPANTTNEYSVTQSIDLQTGNTIQGNTGITFTTDTSISRYEVNDNNNQWVGAVISNVTAGSIEIKLDLTDNQ